MAKIVSAAEAAKLIPDGAVVTVSSSSGLCCPDAVLKAIGERFDAEQHPRNLTMMHAIAAGDIYGVQGHRSSRQEGIDRAGDLRLLSFGAVIGGAADDLADARAQ